MPRSKSGGTLTTKSPETLNSPGRGTSERGKLWPTPAARDYKHPNKADKEGGDHRGDTKSGKQLPNAVGGALNPTWVEWLMGWPLGWTVCALWATAKSRRARRQLGKG